MESPYRRKVQSLLAAAGVTLNGCAPWDIRVHNQRFYGRVMSQGSLGLGESYIDGWWDAPALDEFFNKLLSAGLDKKVKTFDMAASALMAWIFNPQRRSKAFEIGERHYDMGNELYTKMLDGTMSYSCGYWKDAKTLEKAQITKLDLCCRKLHLKPGMRLLDIGCGWGGLARHAAEHYGVSVVGVTVSKEQAQYARERSKGLPVEILLTDYRDLKGEKFDRKFERIVSVGMFEHVGVKNYREYMKKAEELLKDDSSIFLLHTIGKLKSGTTIDPWIRKYIFPRSMLPSMRQIDDSSEGVLVAEDMHNFGKDYDPTLMAWHKNFSNHWEEIRASNPKKYTERFKRMWDYYLLSCAGSFRARQNQLWQIVFSKKGLKEVYVPVR